MAAKSSLNLVEMHVEKALLGLSVLCTIALGVYFFALGPNRVEYSGQKVGPDEVDDLITQRAQGLKQAIDQAKVDVPPVPTYANKLQEQFTGGLFVADPNGGPPLPKALRVAAAFGMPVPPPPGERDDRPTQKVAVVVPLKPRTAPALRTGISLVERRPVEIKLDSSGGTPPPTEPETVERSWVSGAVYFPKEAQRREMTAAGYEGYRAKVYLVGVDVQRQVMTASGEYSDWAEVEPSLAMPKVSVPPPAFDTASGELLNQAELDQALEVVKNQQQTLMQPEFYPVKAGDPWLLPPLPGFEDAEEEEPSGGGPPPEPEPKPAQAPAPRPPSDRPPPGVNPPGEPPPHAPPPPAANPAEKQRAAKDLADARKALTARDKPTAISRADAVISNVAATAGQKKAAERVKLDAEKIREAGPQPVSPQEQTGPVTDPKSAEHDPAVFFHDDTVEPGKTYRYRVRVKLWNRYLGKRAAVTDPLLAQQVTLAGDWSLPSDPIRVAPKTHFFLRGSKTGDVPAAVMDVFTWHDGSWHKESFTVQVGDTIGEMKEVKTSGLDEGGKPAKASVDFSTGAVVLDIRLDDTIWSRRSTGKGEFAYSEAKSLVLVYLDPADGQVKQRIDRIDRVDRTYKRLKSEVSE